MAIELDERPAAPVATATGLGGPPLRQRLTIWAVLIPVVILAVAGTLRFYRLGDPERCYFDETYYYYDAREFIDQGVESGFAVHPPVGKWMIAAGLALFGVDEGSRIDDAVTTEPDGCNTGEDEEPNPAAREREAAESFARRASAALFGTLSVGLTYLIGLRLFRRRGLAALAALLVAVDGLALTMSRISMLDVFVSFWILLGVWLLLIDRDRQYQGPVVAPLPTTLDPDEPTPQRERMTPFRAHTFRWLAGVAFGLALATKWSALLAILAGGAFILISDVVWSRRTTGRWTAGMVTTIASGFLALVAIPLTVYFLSYASWFANVENTRKAETCPPETCSVLSLDGFARVVGGWWDEQQEIYRFHRDLEADHPYRAPAWTWLILSRPVAYYYESCNADRPDDADPCVVDEGNVAEILGIGNPAIWWMALPAYLAVAWSALRRRNAAAWTILAFLFLQYLPWLASPRTVFLFYMTPVVPFIALAVAHASRMAMRTRGMRWVPATVAVLSVAGVLFWFPIFVGLEIPREAWDVRIWIRPGWI